jgi:pyruvate dehydrogenase E1 component alpha subunit
MAGKKKKRTATTSARKSKALKAKPRSSARKKPAKKVKTADTPQAVLNAQKLKQLYATMLKCRLLAERVQRYERSTNSIARLEATLVGAAAHLLPKDCMALEHGGFLASLIRGTSLHSIVTSVGGSHTSNGAGSLPTNALNNAATPSMAIGLALAREMKGKSTVTLMFGTLEPGTEIFEADAMAAAATEKLPLVCLVENSFDSRAESHILPAPSTSHDAGSAYYPRITVDGADVVAVFRVTQEAIRRAREGHGPALIECMTSRKTNTGDSDSKAAQHTAQDPLQFMEKYLKRRELWSADWSRKMAKEFTKELNDAFAAGHQNPQPDETFDNVYSADSSGGTHLVKASQ